MSQNSPEFLNLLASSAVRRGLSTWKSKSARSSWGSAPCSYQELVSTMSIVCLGQSLGLPSSCLLGSPFSATFTFLEFVVHIRSLHFPCFASSLLGVFEPDSTEAWVAHPMLHRIYIRSSLSEQGVYYFLKTHLKCFISLMHP